jgi:nucleoside-diphosphate-sugar epimerase
MGKVLVTGVAGFIGSHLAEALLNEGVEVVGLDCLTEYYSPELKLANVEPLLANPSFTFVEEDLISAELDLDGVDTVYHLAAQPGVRDSWGDAFSEYLRCNLQATQRLLDLCVASPSRPRVVFASSSSVYGDAESLPVREDDPKAPASPYGVTKLTAEMLCWAYVHAYDLDVTAIRPFTVYGPRQRPDMAFSKFISALSAGRPAEIYGDGLQTRDFTYVSDMVTAFILAARRGAKGTVYNVGGGARASLGECLEMIGRAMGVSVVKRGGPRAKGDVRDTHADITRAGEELGYSPSVRLEDGIVRQVRWARGE